MVLLTNFPPPTEGIRLELSDTRTFIDSRDIGQGCLYIAESRLAWMGCDGKGFSLEYPAISLHAISKDHRTFAFDCIYLMIDGKLPDTGSHEVGAGDTAQEGGDSEEEDENPITEIRFVPSDKGILQAMYDALCFCQNLHPDPADTNSEEDDDDNDFGFEEDEDVSEGTQEPGETNPLASGASGFGVEACSSNGLHRGDPVVDPVTKDMANMDVGQFEDADMDT